MFRFLSLCIVGMVAAGMVVGRVTPEAGAGAAVNPGLAFRVTQRAIDAGIDKGLEFMSMYLHTVSIPDVDEPLFLGSVNTFSRTNLTRFDRPNVQLRIIKNRERSGTPHPTPAQEETNMNMNMTSSLFWNATRINSVLIDRGVRSTWYDRTFNPGNTNDGLGGLNLHISGVNVDMETHSETKMKYIVYGSNSNFDMTISIRDTALDLTTYIGAENGMFKVASAQCEATGNITIRVDGTVNQDLLNFLLDSAFVERTVFLKVCESLIDYLKVMPVRIPGQMRTPLDGFPALTIDYSLTEAPIFGEDYIETRHSGTFHPSGNHQTWPFRAESMYQLSDTSRMVYTFVSEYTLNTLWQSLYLGGHLQWTVTQQQLETMNSNPLSDRILLIYKEMLALMNSETGIDEEMVILDPPVDAFKVSGMKFAFKAKTRSSFFTSDASRNKVLELETDFYVTAEFLINDHMLSYQVHDFDINSVVVHSTLATSRDEINSKLATEIIPAFKRVVIDMGREVTPLPPLPQVGMANFKIFQDTPGVVIVATDISVGGFMGSK